MKQLLLSFVLLLFVAAPALAQVGVPQTGGKLPENLDTISQPLTASTTHTQVAATLCPFTICIIGTASSGDAVKLRDCNVQPQRTLIVNTSGNAIAVFPFTSGDNINGNIAGASVSQPAMTTTLQTGAVEYVCIAVTAAGAASVVTH